MKTIRHTLLALTSSRHAALLVLLLALTHATWAQTMLGTTNLLEGPAVGSDSVVLATSPTNSWTATTNAAWLHLSANSQSGTGSANVIFTCDANPGATRTGTLTIAGLTLNITQAGSTYVAAEPVVTLVQSGLSRPSGVAVDSVGNVYIADTFNNAIEEWSVTDGIVITLVSNGLAYPEGVAVDGAGNVYVADTDNNAIEEWSATNGTVTTLISGLNSPDGVAVDDTGNVYIADSGIGAIVEWSTALVDYPFNFFPSGVAVDVAGNVYFADSDNRVVQQWSMANNTVSTLVSVGLSHPQGVAVDGAGNVYIADAGNQAIEKWTAADNTVTMLVSSGLGSPGGVAVDGAGNVYIADTYNDAIKELPRGFVDRTPKLEGSAAGSDVLPVVLPATENLTGTFAPSSDQPWLTITGITNGVVSFSFTASPAIRTANISLLGQTIPVWQSGEAALGATNLLEAPFAGGDSVSLTVIPTNAPWTATANATWLHLSTANQNGTASTNVVFTFDENLGAPRTGTLTIADLTLTVTQSAFTYSLGATSLVEEPGASSESVSLTVLPANGPWTATANATWLHFSAANQNGTGSTNVFFTFDANPGSTRIGTITIAGLTLTVEQVGQFNLGKTNLVEGASAGSDSVILAVIPANASWTATANATWLHLSAASQSGAGSTQLIFTFDANPGATRIGTLAIAGQTLTVTQAGSTYVAAGSVTMLVGGGLNYPSDLAVDGTGNVYIADTYNQAIEEWTVTNNAVTTLVSSNLNYPQGVAVDFAGNVYIADTDNEAIEEWNAENNSITTLVSFTFNGSYPQGVAVDGAGNVYIADTDVQTIMKWTAANQIVTTLVSSGLRFPFCLAVDVAGNVYIADTYNQAIKEWTAANNTVTTLVSSGLNYPQGVAVDVAGNVYIADTYNQAIKEWTAANHTVTTLASGINYAAGVAVDGAGNVYFTSSDSMGEIPYAFVDPTPRVEGSAAGDDFLPTVLPATQNLLPPFFPTSDQPWLTITGCTNGVVSFSFTACATNRTAHITLLGQSILIVQNGVVVILGATNFLEGPDAGSDSVPLTVLPANLAWTATADADWLHLSTANQSGTGNTNVVFMFDPNPGAARTGTLTIAGQTVTITQSASTYYLSTTNLLEVFEAGSDSVMLVTAATNSWTASADTTWLHLSTNSQSGTGDADLIFTFDANPGATRSGTLTIAGLTLNVTQFGYANLGTTNLVEGPGAGSDSVILTVLPVNAPWTATVNTTWLHLSAASQNGAGNTQLIFTFDANPGATRIGTLTILGLALTVTQAGSTYVAAGTTTLVSSNLNNPEGVAVDGTGNVYIADTYDQAIEEWTVTNNAVTTLVSSNLDNPESVAVDGAGNVYIADTGNNAVKEWTAMNNTVTTLLSSNLNNPAGVTVDGFGNVYFADTGNNAIKEWMAANNLVTTLVSSNLNNPEGVAVDGFGNVCFADAGNDVVKEWSVVNNLVTALVCSNLNNPVGVAVDGGGNVFFADAGNEAIKEWTTANNLVTTLVSSNLNHPAGVAVDGAGNVYFADAGDNAIQELPRAFVDPSAKLESVLAGDDALPVILPATANLLGPFAPASDQSWLTITGVTNGVVSFSFGFNPSPFSRTANITLLGQKIPITQESLAGTAGATFYTFTTLAGKASDGSADGIGDEAQFNVPTGVAVDAAGNLYVTDTQNSTIRMITSAGVVTTIAGVAGSPGTNDGTGSNARFYQPSGVAVDTAGNVYVADTQNSTIRKLIPSVSGGQTNWMVSTIAGFAGSPGNTDGTNSNARFSQPGGVAVDTSGNVYVADTHNSTIREITAAGVVSTIAGLAGRAGNIDGTNGNARFFQPGGVAVDMSGIVYVADTLNSTIRKLIPSVSGGQTNWMVSTIAGFAGSPGNTDGTNSNARFSQPGGVAVDTSGNLYVADTYDCTIRKVLPVGTNWVVRTIAGEAAIPGSTDGTGTGAQFHNPQGLALDSAGDIYVADSDNNQIREVTSAGVVSSLAGSTVSSGSTDGTGSDARFANPIDAAVDTAGNVYVADTLNSTIRKITSAGVVSTFAGNGYPGVNDGTGNNAQFFQPTGVALDTAGNVYVADTQNSTIREITSAGMVITLAGQAGSPGTNDGSRNYAQFFQPSGVAVDTAGNVYVADTQNSTIREVTSAGVITLAGQAGSPGANDGTGGNAEFNLPSGVSVDSAGDLYVADTGNDTIRKITPNVSSGQTSWVVSTIAGLAGSTGIADGLGKSALFDQPSSVAVDNAGNLYVADTHNDTIRKIIRNVSGGQTNWLVSTIAGLANFSGSSDGIGTAARFNNPGGIAVDGAGTLYVADTLNNTIRKGGFQQYGVADLASYSPPVMSSSLTVILGANPPSGAGWHFPWEVAWHDSGDTVSNLAAGNYPIEYDPVPGYLVIPFGWSSGATNNLVPIPANTNVVITNPYYPTISTLGANNGGALTVTLGLNPPSGAGWGFLGGRTPSLPSGYSTNLAAGTYQIAFNPVSGRVTPPNLSVQVPVGQSISVDETYLLAQSAPSGVYLPYPVPASQATNLTQYPFGFNGQLQTDVGYGSGVAVQPNVVLTAAHLVFNDETLAYVSQAYWYFQEEAGVSQLQPQAARGWYLLSSYAGGLTNNYAAQRTNDLEFNGDTPGTSTPQSRNLDVAALYFASAVAGGGYAGYLPSDASPNTWLTSTSLKMLVGYPVDGSQFGDTNIVPGEMYQTSPQPYRLALSTDPVDDQQVYTANWFLSYPGNSGGPVYVQLNGYYYPAGVYLGTINNGIYQSVVRAIDSAVVNLITNAAILGDLGTNYTGGGVITLIAGQASVSNPAYVQVNLGPPGAVSAGAGWCLQGDATYGSAANYTRTVTGSSAVLEFKALSDWNPPADQTVNVTAGQVTVVTANYTMVPPTADLAAGISGPAMVPASSNYLYTLWITNLGPSTASSVTVTDTLPAGVVFVGATGGGTNIAGVVTWPMLASLPDGGTTNYILTVEAPATGLLTNTLSVAATTWDTNSANNTAQLATLVMVSPPVLAAGISGPAIVPVSSNYLYTLWITNLGPSAATSITVTDTLPAGVVFVGATGGGTNIAGVVTWPMLATLPSGETTNYTLTVEAPVTGRLTNTLSVATTAADTNSAINTAEMVTLIIGSSPVLAAGISGPATVPASSNYLYTLWITNFGPSAASSVMVTDTLPTGVVLVAASGGGKNRGGMVTWPTLATLASGGTTNYTLTVKAPASGLLTNTLSAGSATASTNSANSTAELVTRVMVPPPVLAAAISGPATVPASSNYLYTLWITNLGPSVASSMTVTDILPADVVFIGASGGGTNKSGIVTWPVLATLTNRGTAHYTLTVKAPATGLLTNTLSVGSATSATNSPNSTARLVTRVIVPPPVLAAGIGGPATVAASSSYPYTLWITNLGPSVASSVTVTDTLPAGVVFVSASGGGTNKSGVVTWPVLATLTNGGATNYVLAVKAPTLELRKLTNTLSVGSATASTNTAHNTARLVTLVLTPPMLVVNHTNGIGLTGTTGTTYQIEYSTNLATGRWLPLRTNTIRTAGVTNVLAWSPTNGPARFYRALWLGY